MKIRMLSATLLGLATSVLPLGAAVAYIGDNPYIVKLSAPRDVACADTVTISAKVRSSDTSDPAIGQLVFWDLKAALSPHDTLTPAETTTDSEGRTSAVLTFGQVDGERTVRVDIATWPTTIRVTCTGAVAAVSPSPSASAIATSSPTVAPSATPAPSATAAPSPSPDTSASTDSGNMTAAVLPVALGAAVILGLGAMLLVRRRR